MRYVFVYVTLWMMCLVDAAPTWSTTDAIGVPSPRTYGNGLAEGERKRIAKFRADAAKEAFEFAWSGYSKYAFGHDEVLPVTNSYSDSRNGWGASAIDALSTAIIMEETEIVQQILDYIPTIDFTRSQTKDPVSLFETTIRYLGGLLSAYDLLSDDALATSTNVQTIEMLLRQAERLANALSYAFDTPAGIPHGNLYLNNRTTDGLTSNVLADIGTLVLEWTRLSDLTGNQTYARLAQKAESYLLNPKPATSEPWPGLVGRNVSIETGLFTDAFGGWVGGGDSFYEYLIKMYVYDPNRFSVYKDRWITAADSTMMHLASHPSTDPDLTFLAMYNGTSVTMESSHLACFDGGNYILAGLVLHERKYLDFGLQLVASCRAVYNSTFTGIGPEVFDWDPRVLPAGERHFFSKAGFWIQDGFYILRPEVIESFYYAYRATGERVYQEWAWQAFLAINTTARVGSGFSGIVDVNDRSGGGYTDFQESFFLAEVLKYSSMIHAEEAVWQVDSDGRNRYVFNTEAHPLRVYSREE